MILQYILLCVSLYMYFNAPELMDKGFMLLGLFVAFSSIIVLIKSREKQVAFKRQYLRHSSLFIIGFIIVFYQYYIDYIVGLIDDSLKFIWIDSMYVCKALCLSNIALICFIIGYMKSRNREPILDNYSRFSYNERILKKCDAINLNYLYALLLLLLSLYVIYVDKKYLFGGYGKGEEGGIASEIDKLFNSLLLFTVTFKSYLIKNRRISTIYHFISINKVLIFIVLLRVFLILISGARHESLNLLLILLISFLYVTDWKIKLRYIFFSCIFFSLLFTIIGLIRSSEEPIGDVMNSMPISIFPFTSELAGSVRTLHVAVTYFPEQIPYTQGITLLGYFFLFIPGGRSLFFSSVGLPSYLMSSGSFISTIILGEDASWQLGSSCVADIYICFGVVGVLCVFSFWGWLLRKIEYAVFINRKSSLCILSVGFLFYSHCFFINRESLFSSLFGISYLLILSFFFKKWYRI